LEWVESEPTEACRSSQGQTAREASGIDLLELEVIEHGAHGRYGTLYWPHNRPPILGNK
jgi:hypothetical protein